LDLSVFRIDDGERFWYVASSEEEAENLHAKYAGDSGLDETDPEFTIVERLPDDKVLTIELETEDPTRKLSMTCAEWVKREGKPCFLCSTIF
jgi:hypothetical protein